MPKVARYCKAYPVGSFRRFRGWTDGAASPSEGAETAEGAEAARSLRDDDVLFLHEDFRVTDGIFLDENVVFDDVTPEWKDFCESGLGFSVPSHVADEGEPRRG